MFGKSVVDGEVCDLVVLGRSLPGDLVGPDLLGGEGGEKGDHRGLASFGGFREGVPLFHGPDQLDHVLVLDLHQLTLVDPEAVPEEEVTGFLKSLQKVLPKVLELLLRKGALLLSRVFRFAEGSLLLFVQGTGPGHGDFLLLEKGEDSLELTLPFVIEFQEIHSQSGRTLFLDDSKNDGTVKLFRSVLRETEFVVFQIHKDQIPDGIPVLLFIDLDPLRPQVFGLVQADELGEDLPLQGFLLLQEVAFQGLDVLLPYLQFHRLLHHLLFPLPTMVS